MFVRYLKLLLLYLCALPVAMADVSQRVHERLLALQPDLVIENIGPAGLPGWFEVQLRGAQILYTDAEVGFVFYGELFQIDNGEAISLTQLARGKIAAQQIDKLDAADMVIFAAKNPKTTITVFTDVGCSYCQKLHSEVAQLNAAGVTVRYLAFPNGGISAPSYREMVNVWCADDRQQALTMAKQNQSLAVKNCKNPVEKQHALGRTVGVQGTPSIVLESGELIPGYIPVEQLAAKALAAAK